MCSFYLGILSMVIPKPGHSTCKPTMFTGGMGQATYLPIRSVQTSHASRKTRLYGSDLLSLSLYTRGSIL